LQRVPITETLAAADLAIADRLDVILAARFDVLFLAVLFVLIVSLRVVGLGNIRRGCGRGLLRIGGLRCSGRLLRVRRLDICSRARTWSCRLLGRGAGTLLRVLGRRSALRRLSNRQGAEQQRGCCDQSSKIHLLLPCRLGSAGAFASVRADSGFVATIILAIHRGSLHWIRLRTIRKHEGWAEYDI